MVFSVLIVADDKHAHDAQQALQACKRVTGPMKVATSSKAHDAVAQLNVSCRDSQTRQFRNVCHEHSWPQRTLHKSHYSFHMRGKGTIRSEKGDAEYDRLSEDVLAPRETGPL